MKPHCDVMFLSGAGGELQTYQIRTASASSSLPQTVVMASSVGLTPNKTDDPTMKREIRLAKNRYLNLSNFCLLECEKYI